MSDDIIGLGNSRVMFCVFIGYLVATAIELNPDYMRALLRRAELYEKTDKLDEALDDYKKVLERDPSHVGARQACMVSYFQMGHSGAGHHRI